MTVNITDLHEFANNQVNEIKLGKCDSNAYKLYLRYGGEIHSGYARYSNQGQTSEPKPHYWNILQLESNHSKAQKSEIIDIYNYKSNREGIYLEHNGKIEAIEDFMKNTKL